MKKPDLSSMAARILKRCRRVHFFHSTLNSRCGILESGGRKYILKERYADGLRRENAVLGLLQEKGFAHIPRTYGIVSFEGKRMILQDYIDGGKPEQDKGLFDRHADDIAIILARLHILTRKGSRPSRYYLNKKINALGHIALNVEALAGRVEALGLKRFMPEVNDSLTALSRVVRHGGGRLTEPVAASLVNHEMEFVVDGRGKVYLLDWEAGSFDDAAYDIADLKYIYPNMDLERFADAFVRKAGMSHDVLARIRLYLPMILVQEIYYETIHYVTCDVFNKIPSRILAGVAQARLVQKLSRLKRACADLRTG